MASGIVEQRQAGKCSGKETEFGFLISRGTLPPSRYSHRNEGIIEILAEAAVFWRRFIK